MRDRASTRRFRCMLLATALLVGAGPTTGWAQNNPGGNIHDNSGLNGSLSHEDLEKMGGNADKAKADPAQNTPEARAKIRSDAEALVATLQLTCDVRDAVIVVSGTSRPPGASKDVKTEVYEVACANGLGYLLERQGTSEPVGLSCFAAYAARIADAAKGKAAGFYCKLPQSRDVKAMAATLLAGAGADCAVKELRWFGRSAASKTEYTELACDSGKGFLLRTPLPGSTVAIAVTDCADAVKQGIKCKMTATAPIEAGVSLDTFKGALTKNGVSCPIDQVREIGQENNRKRYVVEYLCANEHNGKVAYIPLEGNTNPFEEETCSAAVEHAILCTLQPTK